MDTTRAPGAKPWDTFERPTHALGPGEVVVRLLVAYDGAPFAGVVEQRDQPTVAGVLADAMEAVLGSRPKLAVAGRTDAGVHAFGQVFSAAVDAQRGQPARLAGAISGRGKGAVALRLIEVCSPTFHARHSAVTRRYRYLVRAAPVADPLRAGIEWHVRERADLAVLRSLLEAVVGEHDFGAFCRRPPTFERRPPDGEPEVVTGSTRRVVTNASWNELADGVLLFEVEASSFCQQMVRSLVGAMVDVGRGRMTAARFRDHVREPDRHCPATRAPARGLALVGVRYPDGFGEPFVDPAFGTGGLPVSWPAP